MDFFFLGSWRRRFSLLILSLCSSETLRGKICSSLGQEGDTFPPLLSPHVVIIWTRHFPRLFSRWMVDLIRLDQWVDLYFCLWATCVVASGCSPTVNVFCPLLLTNTLSSLGPSKIIIVHNPLSMRNYKSKVI